MRTSRKQDKDNNDVLDLATDISDIVDFTFVVSKVETISQLNSTIGELRGLFIQINELVTRRANRGNLSESYYLPSLCLCLTVVDYINQRKSDLFWYPETKKKLRN